MMKDTSDQCPRQVYTKMGIVRRFGIFFRMENIPMAHVAISTPKTE